MLISSIRMNIRIISGKYGKRIIKAPDNGITHPMSERIRNSLFNIIGDEIVGANILDAFAGSGSLGFEAISRGAAHASFIENDRVAYQTLIDNIEVINVRKKCSTFFMDLNTYIAKNSNIQYDVIFTDPPYDNLQLSTISRLVKILSPNGIMILSYPGRGEIPPVDGIVVVDNRSYGTAALAFYRKK